MGQPLTILLLDNEFASPKKSQEMPQIFMVVLLFITVFPLGVLVYVTIVLLHTDTSGFRAEGDKFPFYQNALSVRCSTTAPTTSVNYTTLFSATHLDTSDYSRLFYTYKEPYGICPPQRNDLRDAYDEEG